MSETYSTYDAKAKLSEILRKVEDGRTIYITRRGERIAEIRPVGPEPVTLEQRIIELTARGVIVPASNPRALMRPLAHRPGALREFLEDLERMTAAYVDTSCLVAVVFGEPGHEALASRLLAFDRIYSSNLLEAELSAALSRKGATDDGSITGQITWVLPERALSAEIRSVVAAGYLRGADLWHLACALFLSPDPRELVFLTVDQQQAGVAATLGFAGQDAVAPTGSIDYSPVTGIASAVAASPRRRS